MPAGLLFGAYLFHQQARSARAASQALIDLNFRNGADLAEAFIRIGNDPRGGVLGGNEFIFISFLSLLHARTIVKANGCKRDSVRSRQGPVRPLL